MKSRNEKLTNVVNIPEKATDLWDAKSGTQKQMAAD